MRVFSIAKGFHRLWKNAPPELTPKERDRLRALTLFEERGDASLASRTFGISRATLYRWHRGFNPRDLTTLKEQSRRPRRLRKPAWSLDLVLAVQRLRQQYGWGKDKLAVLLRQEDCNVSVSTVGRILSDLKRRGALVEPKRRAISAKRRPARPYATRKPREYTVRDPGDLVQVDTLDIRPLPGIALKQFTARDSISKWDVIEARRTATAKTATEFLDTLTLRMPFPLRAIQVDGGSEFYRDFESACQKRGIKLFVLPPKSPKLNGGVERANRTHTEEFYERVDCPWTVNELNRDLLRHEHIYNCIRPHQALGQKTPLQFLKSYGIIPESYPSPSHMS